MEQRAMKRLSPRERAKEITCKTVNYFFLVLVSLFFLFPFFFMLFKAMMGDAESIGNPTVRFLPSVWHFEYFAEALDAEILSYLKNTLIVVLCNCISVPLSSALCAYGFARLKFKTRDFWFFATLATMMLPASVTQVPLYALFYKLGMIGNISSLIIPNLFGGGAMNIFLMRQFMRTVPVALDEAAIIDGASRFRIFWNIMLPACVPILIFTMINAFLGSWNDFTSPLIYANRPSSYTLALGIYQKFLNSSKVFSNIKMATGVLMSITPIIVFLIMQKQLINGVVTTGVKG